MCSPGSPGGKRSPLRAYPGSGESWVLNPGTTGGEGPRSRVITKGVHLVGDVMAGALAFNRGICTEHGVASRRRGLQGWSIPCRQCLTRIIRAGGETGVMVVFPVHHRTRKFLQMYGLMDTRPGTIRVTEPPGYPGTIRLMAGALKILTDSGGIQKETYMPGVTLRDNIVWVETLEGWGNVLVGRMGRCLPGRSGHHGQDNCSVIPTRQGQQGESGTCSVPVPDGKASRKALFLFSCRSPKSWLLLKLDGRCGDHSVGAFRVQ